MRTRFSMRLHLMGEWLRLHQTIIQRLQWTVVIVYVVLLLLPTWMPLPADDSHIYNNIVRFAQFLFWGIWWPFVILSMLIFGRLWCGIFCPEGSLTEWASQHGVNHKPVPRWIKWPGWPFVAFVATTVYGQLISVYEYPLPALLILGGSTVAAMFVGFVWVKERRLWCRYLCPVSGVFSILSRLAPIQYQVDRKAWESFGPNTQDPVICAPLINIRQMESNQDCHMCGRCSNYRSAVTLAVRSPNQEILAEQAPLSRWHQRLLVFGLMGVAMGAFQWTVSPWFILLKQCLAERFAALGWWSLFDSSPAWWVMMNYPQANDVFLWIDGISIILYIALVALVSGGLIYLSALVSSRVATGGWSQDQAWRMAECLTPLAGLSVFLGLSMLTISQLSGDGVNVPYLLPLRFLILAVAALWSLWLVYARTVHVHHQRDAWSLFTAISILPAVAVVCGQWLLVFWVW